jgi:GINS complex subunit 3
MSRYFSIDDIIAEDERTPLTWRVSAEGVSWLDASLGESGSIASGTGMELPLWLAEELKLKDLVEVSLPAAYTRKSRANIKADAVAAKLRELSPSFYSVGLRLGPLLKEHEEARLLSQDVREVLADRAAGILQRARTGLGADVSSYRGKLTDLEQQIFDAASAFTAAKLSWRREEAGMMRPPAAALGGMGGGMGGGQVTSVEASLLQSSVMPLSRGQRQQRSLLSTGNM